MRRAAAILICALAGTVCVPAQPPESARYLDPAAPLEERTEDLLGRLTLQEKIALMSGASLFATAAIPRLGIPSLRLADGPNGVRSNEGEPATVFPTGSALAATWNPAAVEAVGATIGREARALNVQMLLGPNVNLQRVPVAGRNFEAYSEDPFLTGTLGASFVRGVQSEGVGTSVKHFVANEQELERLRVSSNIDERTLRELYLVPFEMIVRSAHPWAVMVAYNRLNGTYMSENAPLIREVLEREWGFDGMVLSDWGAVHSTAPAANAGLDLEMPGPPRYFGTLLEAAVREGKVQPSVIDEAARRVLRTVIRSGVLDGPRSRGERLSARNRAVAVEAAGEAITLLKNEREVLPLDPSRVRSIAVIGPNADVPLYQGGGSASVIPARIATPLSSLTHLVGGRVRIRYARGADNDPVPPPIDARLLSPGPRRDGRGLRYRYYARADFGGTPAREGLETYFDKTLFASGLTTLSARWEGYLWPPQTGEYELSTSGPGAATVYLDGRAVLGEGLGSTSPPRLDFGAPARVARIALHADRAYPIRVDYVSAPGPFHSLHLGLRLPPPSLEQAVRVAHEADAALVFVGSSRTSETEGRDRADLELWGRQNELVEAVLAANPNTVIVLNNGAPLVLPWVRAAPALIEAWLAGEGGPDALAAIVFGETNPSGKLPFTLPQRLEDNPSYAYYRPGDNADYGERLSVGYRDYDARRIEPLFPFGFGLSYTTFRYSRLRVSRTVGSQPAVQVAMELTNTGERRGAEIVELYVSDPSTAADRPVKELKGFRKVSLAPGETRTVEFTLSARDLSYYDALRHAWTRTQGTYRVLLGSSSRDIRLESEFRWD